MSEEQLKKFSILINFIVASINLVAVGNQAEASLKVWDGILFQDDNNIVGSEKHSGYSNGKTGTTQLIGTVCKAMQQRGYEKSGCMVSLTFMKEEFECQNYHYFLFLGNKFNILFLNGVGTISITMGNWQTFLRRLI